MLDAVIPKLEAFSQKFENPAFVDFIGKALLIGTAIGGILLVVGPLLTVFGTLTSSVGSVVGVFGVAGGAFKKFSGFFKPVVGLLSSFSTGVLGLASNFNPVLKIFGSAGPKLAAPFISMLGPIAPVLLAISAIVLAIGVLVALGPQLKSAFSSVFDDERIASFKAQFDAIKETVLKIVDAFKSGNFSDLSNLFGDLGGQLGELIGNAIQSIVDLLSAIDWGAVFTQAFEFLTVALTSAWEFLKSFILETDWGGILSDLFNVVVDIFTSAVDALVEWIGSVNWTDVLVELVNFFAGVGGKIIDFLLGVDWLGVLGALVTFFIKLPFSLIKALLSIDWLKVLVSLGTALGSLAIKLLKGLMDIDWSSVGTRIWEAIKSAVSGIGDYLADLADSALSALNPFDYTFALSDTNALPNVGASTTVYQTFNNSVKDLSQSSLKSFQARAGWSDGGLRYVD